MMLYYCKSSVKTPTTGFRQLIFNILCKDVHSQLWACQAVGRNHHHCSSIFTIQGKVTGVIWRVVTPKDKKRNPSPLKKFYEEKKVNVIRRSKNYYILNLCSFHMRMFLPNHKDCIFFSSFELKVILLVSSAKTLCLSLINFCCIFSISLLFFMNSLKPSTSFFFFLNSLFYFQFELLKNSFYNLEIFVFYLWHFFVACPFFSSSLLSFK